MSRPAETKLTVPEAEFVTGMLARDIDREIDAKVIRSSGPKKSRALSVDTLVYIKAVAPFRTELAPTFRKRMSNAVASAVAKGERVAKIDTFQVEIKALRDEILGEYADLERLRKTFIESKPAILGGEYILKGTRIPVRIVADLIKNGATKRDIRSELELTTEQINAAVTFDRVTPRRGRPPIKRRKVTKHVSAD
ncbi:MAG: Uncharacterized protein FD124_1152 [Alphaproteobacteria bacterium]|nr:MAG: Uncharacterized protein FD160_1848 [Caulobacteraceae bacterium]TPW07400.1 MAG: Uncharacterized protein FD124_1152 [Alphaproteobacteria bacterium]